MGTYFALSSGVAVSAKSAMRRLGGDMELKKRSQVERLTIAFSLIDSVWEEMTNGIVEDDMLQIAVNMQTDVNRIVWALNRRMSDE